MGFVIVPVGRSFGISLVFEKKIRPVHKYSWFLWDFSCAHLNKILFCVTHQNNFRVRPNLALPACFCGGGKNVLITLFFMGHFTPKCKEADPRMEKIKVWEGVWREGH